MLLLQVHPFFLGLEQELVVIGGYGEHHALAALPLQLHQLAPLVLPELYQLVPLAQLLDQLELLVRGEQHLAAVLVKENVLLPWLQKQLLLLLLCLNKHVLWVLLLHQHLLLMRLNV